VIFVVDTSGRQLLRQCPIAFQKKVIRAASQIRIWTGSLMKSTEQLKNVIFTAPTAALVTKKLPAVLDPNKQPRTTPLPNFSTEKRVPSSGSRRCQSMSICAAILNPFSGRRIQQSSATWGQGSWPQVLGKELFYENFPGRYLHGAWKAEGMGD
jgi:hypothetical protein